MSNMVYFNHKYLTQPTLTTKESLMKAILDLSRVIFNKIKGKPDKQQKALKKITEVFKPGNQLPILLTGDEAPPKVPPKEQQTSRVHKTEHAQRGAMAGHSHFTNPTRPSQKSVDC